MIKINNSNFYSSWAGLFYTDKEWIHPKRIETIYEFIYVLNGTVYLREEDTEYELVRGDMILLDKGIYHEGYKTSTGITSFYWAHFYIDDINDLPPMSKLIHNFKDSFIFKEYISLFCRLPHGCDILNSVMLNLISKTSVEYRNLNIVSKLSSDIFAWLQINASPTLKTIDVANHFGYSPDHISRILKRDYGLGTKEIIDSVLISNANNLLANTNLSIKEIANELGFEYPNLFSKFYQYHCKILPLEYRSTHGKTRINNR